MSEEFDMDEFVIEEEEVSTNRPFFLALGALLGILLLSLLCLFAVRSFGGNGDPEEGPVADTGQQMTATSISATNEAIATQNSFVTQTIVSMELTEEAPTPTETPTLTPSPTDTSTPTNTPTPTETPVVGGGEDEGEEGEGDGTATPNIAATSIFEGLNTATPDTTAGGNGGTGTTGGTNGTGGPTTLPQTGISLWGGLAAALSLLFLFVVARRMRG